MVVQILAHAGEEHITGVEATVHEWAWYVQLSVFFLALIGVCALLWLITNKVDVVLLVASFLMLITGFLVFSVAPLVSVVAITLGLVSTLSVTLLSLGSPPDKKKK